MRTLNQKKSEFREYVWDHSIDAFQAQFDERRNLSDSEARTLANIASLSLSDPDNAAAELQKKALKNDDVLAMTLQICGLTRSKILQDLKASGEVKDSKLKVPASYSRLPHSEAWQFAGDYIISRLRKVVAPFADQNEGALVAGIQSLNQATWPGYIRQERAKRSGHEAEYRLATTFYNCGIEFAPKMKAENPLCPDAQINGVSFDLVTPSLDKPSIVIKSTVHTSNIGQFGESKDDLEIREARQMLDRSYRERKPLLLAFADGVGFYSNSAGLDGVLDGSDEFCQFKTLWKAVCLALEAEGREYSIFMNKRDLKYFSYFLDGKSILGAFDKEQADLDGSEIECGDALIKIGS